MKKVPEEVAALRSELEKGFNTKDERNQIVGNAIGIYAFYDYDEEPIYVGQTKEKLRSRIGRHLTNQRTDAVAMNVLDPFEVYMVEMWPFWDLQEQIASKRGKSDEEKRSIDENVTRTLNSAEFTVFQQVLTSSAFQAVLNEKAIIQTEIIELPKSYKFTIVPQSVYNLRNHPDIRIARRASTIANLARVISERQVSKGLRRTLVTQARRLEHLASRRLNDFSDEPEEVENEE